jgi:cell division protein FtsI (penicillin-binding protein 3)
VARILLLLPFLALATRAAHLSTDARGSARGIAQTQRVLRLAPERGVIFRSLAKRLEGRRSFVFLSRWVPDERAQQVKELGLDGVGVLYEPRRVYPNRGLAAQVVGFANIDGVGVRG